MNAPSKPTASSLSKGQIVSIFLGLMAALFLSALDQTIVSTALPTIGRQLGNIDQLPWVVTAYLLATTVVTPLYGKLSDIHGRRIMLLIAIGIFLVGSVACALSPTMVLLALARTLQGIGGGGIQAIVMTVIGDIVPPRERGQYQTYTSIVWVTASLAGPALGGFFAQDLSWRAIFWINLPIGLAAVALIYTKLKLIPRNERPHKLDYLGAVLSVAFTLPLLLALSTGGTRYPWLSPIPLALLATSALFLALLIWRLRRAEEPLIPLNILSNKIVLCGTSATFFSMGVFIALSIYVPVFLQTVLAMSASNSGLALIPLTVGTVTGATIAGRLLGRIAHYKRIPLVGLSLALAGTIALYAAPADMPAWLREVIFVVLGSGLGTMMPTITVAVQNSVKVHELGTTTGLINFSRQLGAALAVALFGTVVVGGGMQAGDAAVTPGTIDMDAMIGSFHTAYLIAIVMLLLSMSFVALMKELPLLDRRGRADQEVAATMD